jgi:hypothetical protein
MKTEKIFHKGLDTKITSFENALCNRTGIVISLVLIGFFLAMVAVGLVEVLWLRYVNFVILLGGLIYAFKKYTKKVSSSGMHYFEGLKLGMRITLTAIIPFTVFIAVYLRLDPSFMEYIKQSAEFGKYLAPISAATEVAMEGIVSGFLTSYCLMQYFKSDNEVE